MSGCRKKRPRYPSDAIKEADHAVAVARRAFAAALAERLTTPSIIRWRPGLPTTCWLDAQGRYSHARVITIAGPGPRCLDAPLVVRISINHYAYDHEVADRRRAGWEQRPRRAPWSYELSLLPDQLLTFAPWVAGLAVAKASEDERLLFSPPDACHFWIHPNLLCDYAWTVKAWELLDQYRRAEAERDRQRKARGCSRGGSGGGSADMTENMTRCPRGYGQHVDRTTP